MPITASSVRRVAGRAELRALLADIRRAESTIAFVPTMGALHDGHLALVGAARRHADVVVMSIFVNPTQFGPGEDFARYPRRLADDAIAAHGAGVDILFAPSVEEMYEGAPATVVIPDESSGATRWEGELRPGHFGGVLTIVAKLFNLVAPDVAVFGQKDIQQATLIRAMVRDLDYPIRLVVAPTVRERDGLALSSRNAYLSPDERRQAMAVPGSLAAIARSWNAGAREASSLLRDGRAVLDADPRLCVDYLALVHPETLAPVERADAGTIGIVAVRVGSTRLIDNLVLGAPDDSLGAWAAAQ
jgi:pantoate--beta-alanine ligase